MEDVCITVSLLFLYSCALCDILGGGLSLPDEGGWAPNGDEGDDDVDAVVATVVPEGFGGRGGGGRDPAAR